MKTSIIIPVKDNQHLTEECIKSIKDNTADYELIIVDNGSNPVYKGEGLIIRNEENLGFPKAVNQGIIKSTGEVIVILNNDTIVTPNWLNDLIAHFDDYDMVGPCTNYISGPQQIKIDDYSNPASWHVSAEKYHKENKGQSMPWHRLVFFCVAIKEEVFNRIGLLDEQFSPGNFEDDDFCLRAIEAGFRLGIAQDVFIHHIGQATHKSLNLDFKKLMETNKAKFQAKWPEARYKELQKQNYENCESVKSPAEKTIALVMIVKNEEKGLERAILSCKDFVKEIVIAVDGSSSDDTYNIASKYATTLRIFDWKDDFAKARNEAAEGVEADWILFLDGHEFVKESPNLQEHLNLDTEGLLCTIEMENGAQFRNPRIYKNGIQFEGKVHELQKITKIKPYTEFIVKHDRTGGQEISAALKRNAQRDDQVLRIMGSQLKKDKRNLRALFHIGLYFMGRGRFKKAIKYFNRHLKYSKDKSERWFILFNRAICYLTLGKNFRAFWSASKADDETPNRWEIDKLKGMIYFQAGKYFKAIESFVESFKINLGNQTYKPWTRDECGTWNLIGESWFRLNEYFKAHVAFDAAYKKCKNPTFKKLLYDRQRLMHKMAKPQRSK